MVISMKAARVNAGLTRSRAATAVGVSDSTLSHWELGKSYPTPAQFAALCNLYGAGADDIRIDV